MYILYLNTEDSDTQHMFKRICGRDDEIKRLLNCKEYETHNQQIGKSNYNIICAKHTTSDRVTMTNKEGQALFKGTIIICGKESGRENFILPDIYDDLLPHIYTLQEDSTDNPAHWHAIKAS